MSWEYKYVPHNVVILKYHSAWHRIRAQYIILSTGVTGPGGQLVQIETNQKHQKRNFSLDEIDRILDLSECLQRKFRYLASLKLVLLISM